MIGFLIFLAVVCPIAGLIWLLYYLSKKGEIIQKREEMDAALYSLKAAESKSSMVLGDAASVLSAAVETMERNWRDSREFIMLSSRGSAAEKSEARGFPSLWPSQMYPPGNLVNVFQELQQLSAKEADDIQYLAEKTNARVGEFRATVQKPFARIVAGSMGIDPSDFGFISASKHPALERKSGDRDEEIIFLKPPDKRDDSERCEGAEDIEEHG